MRRRRAQLTVLFLHSTDRETKLSTSVQRILATGRVAAHRPSLSSGSSELTLHVLFPQQMSVPQMAHFVSRVGR